MRTRLVRVRRRPRGIVWAVIFLALAMGLYIRVSLPALYEMQLEAASAPERGERVTREVTIDRLQAYLISFGGYETRSSAKIEAARYVSRGAAGYILDDDRLYVIGAGYANREDAEKACAQLREREGMTCSVIAQDAPALTIRVTAGSEQIAAFLEAEETLRSTAGAIGQLAVSIDRGDATARQAIGVIQTHLRKVEAAEEALDRQMGDTKTPLFEGILTLLDDLEEQLEEMMEETGAMALSSRLKYAYIDFRVREIRLMNGLGG